MNKRRVKRIATLCATIAPERLQVLCDLLSGHRAMLVVKGEPYAVRFAPTGATFQVLDFSAAEHTALGGRCSCEDSRFRGRVCKHILALEELGYANRTV